MTRTKLLSMVSAAALAMTPITALAQDKSGENVQPTEPTAEVSAVGKVALAQDLFAYAQEGKNAVAALAAAQIMQGVDAKDVEREKTTSDNEDMAGVTEEADGADAPMDAEAMLTAALEYAGGDPAVTGLIEDAQAEGSRGRIGGASRTLSRLPAGKIDLFKVPFYGGRFAELAVVGDGDANLDLLVTDENGNTICLDKTYTDKIYCSFTPAWDGYFLVAVANQGRKRNSYYILTN